MRFLPLLWRFSCEMMLERRLVIQRSVRIDDELGLVLARGHFCASLAVD